jgi:TusE/DsrC/DsvC family sulfur relay protein
MANEDKDMSNGEKMEFAFHIHEYDVEIEDWDRNVATELAEKEGIQLTDAHWEVASYLRKLYQGSGPVDYARDLSAILDQRFKSKGGLKYLFTLFPNGPVTQGCKIAGLSVPHDSTQNSFGSVS